MAFRLRAKPPDQGYSCKDDSGASQYIRCDVHALRMTAHRNRLIFYRFYNALDSGVRG